jgi:uncharacterized protein (TIGR03437 family)
LANETISLFANGFGSTSTPIVGGFAMQSGNLPVVPIVRIGGIDAVVKSASLVGPGQYQFNVVVPVGAADGDNTLQAIYNGLPTPAGVVVTVKK